MRLDPLDEVAVGECRLDRAVDIEAVRPVEFGIVMPFHAAHEVGRQKRINAARRGFDDIAAERGKRHQARATLIDERRAGRMHADQIGVEPKPAGDVPEDMGMRIDQPGQDQRATHIDRLSRPREIPSDRRNLAVGDRDMLDTVDPLRRIDDPSALQNQVKALLLLHIVLLLRRARYRLNSASAPLRCFCLAAISARARAISPSKPAMYSSSSAIPKSVKSLGFFGWRCGSRSSSSIACSFPPPPKPIIWHSKSAR